MKIETYIESLHNEGLGIEKEFTTREGERFVTIEVTDNIAINLYLDNSKEVHALTVYSYVGVEDDLHYKDTMTTIEAVSRLLLSIGRRDRRKLYDQVIGKEVKTVTLTSEHIVTQEIKDNILQYSIVQRVE